MNTMNTTTHRLIRSLEVFRTLEPNMTCNAMMAYLVVSENDNISVGDVADKIGVAHASASRNIGALSSGVDGRPGLGLILNQETPGNRRRRTLSLTPKGKRVLSAVHQAIEGN